MMKQNKLLQKVLEMMELIEKNHVLVAEGNAPDMDAVYRAEELADFVNEKLSIRAKKAWRWRILYIRTKIDRIVSKICMEEYKGEAEAVKKSKYTPTEWLYHNEEAQGYMQELCKFYNCVDLREDRMNRYTLPPVKDGKVNR